MEKEKKDFVNKDENLLGLAFTFYIFGDKDESVKLNRLIKEVIEEVKVNFDDIVKKYGKENKDGDIR